MLLLQLGLCCPNPHPTIALISLQVLSIPASLLNAVATAVGKTNQFETPKEKPVALTNMMQLRAGQFTLQPQTVLSF